MGDASTRRSLLDYFRSGFVLLSSELDRHWFAAARKIAKNTGMPLSACTPRGSEWRTRYGIQADGVVRRVAHPVIRSQYSGRSSVIRIAGGGPRRVGRNIACTKETMRGRRPRGNGAQFNIALIRPPRYARLSVSVPPCTADL
jgi:hypothetical protein